MFNTHFDELIQNRHTHTDIFNKPYHEYGKYEINEFVRIQSSACSEMIRKYSNKYDELQRKVSENAFRYEYGSCKGNTLNRGIYHAGEAEEFIITNVWRGHELKKTSKRGEYYRYTFDKDSNLLCAEIIENEKVLWQEFIVCENETIYGIKFYCKEYNSIHSDSYKDGYLQFSYCFLHTVENLCLYEYEENGKRSVAIFYPNYACSISKRILLKYEYNDNDILIGARDEDGFFYSVKGKYARKYITASKICEAMKIIISDWQDITSDIYALSVYFEDNTSNDKTSIYLGYNTEKNYKSIISSTCDEQEARWNYACWLQNNEPIFKDDNSVYVPYIESGGIGRLLANAVKQLHKSGILTEKFGKEIPVIIHELEYYPQIAEFNISGNGKRLIPKDFIDFCGL